VLLLLIGGQFFFKDSRRAQCTDNGAGRDRADRHQRQPVGHGRQDHYLLLGTPFSAGGITGLPFKSFLIAYTNTAGAVIILLLLWIVGLILATRFSLVTFRCPRGLPDPVVLFIPVSGPC
jgi:hypothetical protein